MGAAIPPGWYSDVERPGGERFWDGTAWTEHRRGADGDPPAFGEAPHAFGTPPDAVGSTGGYQDSASPQSGSSHPGVVPSAYGVPAYGSPAGYQPYGTPGTVYPRSAVAGWALGLSIAGLVLTCCGGILLSVPGTIMGWTQMKAVDRGERDPGARGTAKAAFIVGIVGIALFASLLALWLVGLAVGET